MSAHDPLLDLLSSALQQDIDGDVIGLDEDLYRQSSELVVALGADWGAVLSSLPERVRPEQLLYRPHLWFQVHAPQTWEREARLYACDCVERVLPLFDAAQPDGTHLLDVIQIARRFAGGKPSRSLEDARDTAEATARTVRAVWATSAAAQAAGWAASAAARAADPSVEAAVRGAVESAARAAEVAAESIAARARERHAQWTLLVTRLCRRSEPGFVR